MYSKSWVLLEFHNKVLCILESVMIKKNIVSVPFVLLNRNDKNVCISAVLIVLKLCIFSALCSSVYIYLLLSCHVC